MKRMKKFLALLLTVAMLLVMTVPVGLSEEGFKYLLRRWRTWN